MGEIFEYSNEARPIGGCGTAFTHQVEQTGPNEMIYFIKSFYKLDHFNKLYPSGNYLRNVTQSIGF